MSVGITLSKSDIDVRLGQLGISLNSAFNTVKLTKTYLDTQTDANLIALGYTQGEVNTLRSAILDLDNLRQVWEGTRTQGTAYDFRTFEKLLWGFGG